MATDIVDRLRAMAGPIEPNVCTEAADEIERLRGERNEARRQVCEMCEANGDFAAERQAAMRGWDCFKETAK